MIGGGGEQLTLKIVAQYADVWNFAGGPVDTFKHKMTILNEHCAAVGRNPDEIVRSIQLAVNYEDFETTITTVQEFVDAGATHIILALRYPYPDQIVTRLAEQVVPRIQAKE